MKTKLVSIILFLTIIHSNSHSQDHISDNGYILGKWSEINVKDFSASFNKDGSFSWGLNTGLSFEGKFKLNFELNKLYLEGNNGLDIIFNCMIYENTIVLWNYKTGEGIYHHIDELYVLKRLGTQGEILSSGSVRKERYIIPNGFKGNVRIGFESIETEKLDFLAIDIPSNGCIKVDQKESILTYALEQYEFIQNGKRLPFLKWFSLRYGGKTFEDFELNLTYVIIDGFNQWPRPDLNYDCQMYFNENVFMFRVDTLKNLLEAW